MGQEFKHRKIPMRQCLGCNEHKPKNELLRVLRTPTGEILLDFSGKKSGRGAYICYDSKCLKKARKSKRIEVNLDISIPDEIYESMERELEDYERS